MMKKLISLGLISLLFLGGLMGGTNQVILNVDSAETKISRHIYGHFSEHLGRCIYDGIWVGEDSDIPNTNGIRNKAVQALKEVNIPNLRWPGGCFADEYHWKDGIGPKDEREPMINTHWGMVSEDNSFGTHEFLELCDLIDAEPVIAGNLGSGTVKELSDWVEYCNADIKSDMTQLRKKNGKEDPWYVKYWGVGNESWGCGGNMDPTQYYRKMSRYSTYMRSYPDKPIYKVAVGPGGFNLDWTREFMKNVKKYGGSHLFDGYSLHYYTITHNWQNKGSATDFNMDEYFTTIKKSLRLEELINKNMEIINEHVPEADIDLVVDEWGNWFDVKEGTNPAFLYQQNSLRDAMTASASLNIFNQKSDVVKMANLAQTVNVLQALLLTKDEEVVKTPTYYVFKMYKEHQGAKLIPAIKDFEKWVHGGKQTQAITSSASINEDGNINITLSNFKPEESNQVIYTLKGKEDCEFVDGGIITADKVNSYNKFDQKENVTLEDFSDVDIDDNEVTVNLPPKSVVRVEVK